MGSRALLRPRWTLPHLGEQLASCYRDTIDTTEVLVWQFRTISASQAAACGQPG